MVTPPYESAAEHRVDVICRTYGAGRRWRVECSCGFAAGPYRSERGAKLSMVGHIGRAAWYRAQREAGA